MNIRSICRFAAAVLLVCSASAWAHEDHGKPQQQGDARKPEETAFGREGDPSRVTRTIALGMSDAMRFTPAEIIVKRGETVRFLVRNEGKLLHEMVLGTPEELKAHAELMKKFPDMEHADANMVHVKPGASGEIVWQFTQAGEFQFACLLPGHYEAGMVGKLRVK